MHRLPVTISQICVFGLLATASTGCVERLIYEGIKGEGGSGSDGGSSSSGADECRDVMQCADSEVCFEGVCVGTGSQRFSLSWTPATDLDLHVITPTGDHIHFAAPLTDYGHLDVDDCVDSVCFDQSGVHVENVFFEDNAPRGTYVTWVENFNGALAADYRIEVVGEVNQTLAGSVAAVEGDEGPRHEVLWN